MFRPPQYVALLPLGPTSTLRHIDNWWGNIWISTNRDPVNTSDMEENTEKTKKNDMYDFPMHDCTPVC